MSLLLGALALLGVLALLGALVLWSGVSGAAVLLQLRVDRSSAVAMPGTLMSVAHDAPVGRE